MLIIPPLWPTCVLVSRLSQSLKETGRYAVHAVSIEAIYPTRRILLFNKLGGVWNSKTETVATNKVRVLSLIRLIFSYIAGFHNSFSLNTPSGWFESPGTFIGKETRERERGIKQDTSKLELESNKSVF